MWIVPLLILFTWSILAYNLSSTWVDDQIWENKVYTVLFSMQWPKKKKWLRQTDKWSISKHTHSRKLCRSRRIHADYFYFHLRQVKWGINSRLPWWILFFSANHIAAVIRYKQLHRARRCMTKLAHHERQHLERFTGAPLSLYRSCIL